MKKPDNNKLVLFVCTGNSCRSVIAQNLFQKLLEQKGLSEKIKVASAGTAVHLRIKPIRGTQKVLQEEGISVRNYRAQKITSQLLHQAALIVVMEKRHRQYLLDRDSNLAEKIFLINQFLPDENFLDLPDPITKPLFIYQKIKNRIKETLPGILKKVENL